MLARLKSLAPWAGVGQLNILVHHFTLKKTANFKEVSEKHIQQANSIKELISPISVFRLSDHPLFQTFMRKFTKLLLTQNIDNPQSIECLEKILFEVRKLSSSETRANSSDLLNYQLLFKQLARDLGNKYKLKGFQVRASMVAESIPLIASFEGCQPAAVALLHYMSTYSQTSKPQMKKNILNYILRLNISHRVSQNIFQNQDQFQKQAIALKEKTRFSVQNALIVLSSSEIRPIQTLIQKKLIQLALFNINKNMLSVMQFLNMRPLASSFKLLHDKSWLYPQKEVKKHLNNNQQLKKFSSLRNQDGTPILVLNTQQKFIQASDLFTKILTYQYKNMLSYEINYRSCDAVYKYFYSVFFLSKDMKIWVSTDKNQHKNWFKSSTSKQQPQYAKIKQIHLWKIARYILEGLVYNKIYIQKKQQFYTLLIKKIMQVVQQDLKRKNPNEKLQQYIPSIIKIFSLLPVQQMQEYHEKFPTIHKDIGQFIKKYLKKLPKDSQSRLEVVKNLIKLVKLKNTLFISKTKWIQIFQIVIEQDEKIEFWNLYFFLGSGDKQLINCIPFGKMVTNLSNHRHVLDKNDQYIPLENRNLASSSHKLSTKLTTKLTQRTTILSVEWEQNLLRFHGLIILTNKEADLSTLLKKHSKNYELRVEEVENIFQNWLKPFKETMLYGLQSFTPLQKETEIKLTPKFFQVRPIAYFGKYFFTLFIETECFYQLKLLQRVMKNPSFDNFSVSNHINTTHHFLPYLLVIILSLGDKNRRKAVLKNYPIEKILKNDFKTNQLFRISYFKQVVNEFYCDQQWDYLFFILGKLGLMFNAQDIYFDYLSNQEINMTTLAYPQHSTLTQNFANKQFGSLNLDREMTYTNILKKQRVNPEAYEKLIKRIFKQQLRMVVSQDPYDAGFMRISEICLCLYQVCRLHHENYKEVLARIVDKEDIVTIKKKFLSLKSIEGLEFTMFIFHLKMLGFLDEQIAIHVLRTVRFSKNINLAQLLCLSFIGRDKAQEYKFLQQGKWDLIEIEAYKISSQIQSSVPWLLAVINFSKPKKLQYLIGLTSRVKHPLQRQVIAEELNQFIKKHNLKHDKIILDNKGTLDEEEIQTDEIVAEDEDLSNLMQADSLDEGNIIESDEVELQTFQNSQQNDEKPKNGSKKQQSKNVFSHSKQKNPEKKGLFTKKDNYPHKK